MYDRQFEIDDDIAILFSTKFYTALLSNKYSVEESFRFAKRRAAQVKEAESQKFILLRYVPQLSDDAPTSSSSLSSSTPNRYSKYFVTPEDSYVSTNDIYSNPLSSDVLSLPDNVLTLPEKGVMTITPPPPKGNLCMVSCKLYDRHPKIIPAFHDRDEEMTQIFKFINDGDDACRLIVVCGGEGVGKTEVCVCMCSIVQFCFPFLHRI